MKLLREISDKDFKLKHNKDTKFGVRKAAQAVILDKEGKVAVLHATKHNYHKIAGGGIEEGENIKIALAREIYEETGAKAKVGDEVGVIIEYKEQHKRIQISYCYMAKVTSHGKPHFTKSEKDEGFVLEWLTIDEAIKKFKKDDHSHYGAKFMSTRDLTFLLEAKKLIKLQKAR